MGRRVGLLGLFGLHLGAAVLHGLSHGAVPVHLPAALNAVVLLTTFVGPIAGGALAWRDHPLGIPLFTVSMAGALTVGGLLHFLVENPDHVSALPHGQWRFLFQASAAAVAVTPALGVLGGLWLWQGAAHRPESERR